MFSVKLLRYRSATALDSASIVAMVEARLPGISMLVTASSVRKKPKE